MHMPADSAILASLSDSAPEQRYPDARVAGRWGNRKLVEMKAVDSAYPLVGQVELRPAGQFGCASEFRAVADSSLLTSLGFEVVILHSLVM